MSNEADTSRADQRHPSIRRAAATNEELPCASLLPTTSLHPKLTFYSYFSSLGALPDFADSLIEFAFDRQSNCDPAQHSYYFECLQIISESRNTEALQMKVATLSSQDLVSRRDLSAAYRHLQVHGDARNLSDERIVEVFQARVGDLGVTAADEARQALYKIGQFRQSQVIINASRQSVDTYEDALSWLGNGASKQSSDDSLLAILTVKASESAANEEIGQKAIYTIAKARQSNMLNNWLLTGRADGYTMNVKEALLHFSIEQDFKEISAELWPVLFDGARNERPGDQTEKAIKAIQEALAGMTDNGGHAPETWPVGLTSHGNTCYLNSLLQYYFSIKPLRDIILSYDDYKMDLPDNAQKQERVGQRTISLLETKGGQRFAEDLKQLFQRMIKEPSTAVKPEEDLVCRAFLPPKDYALLASSVREQAAAVNGADNAVDEKLTDAIESTEPDHVENAIVDTAPQSDASSNTLVASMNGEDGDVAMKNVEGGLPPTPPASPGGEKPEPAHAPPLPPRRFSTTKEQALALAQEKARQQQDVTEVHDSVMWRLRSGMRAEGKDDAGEQWDSLRALFAIGMTETTITNGQVGKPQPTFDSSIQLNVPEDDIDVNAALDDVFDLQEYEGNANMQTYKSIRKLPPLLQISIPRIGFDKKTGQAFKSEKMVKLADELQLDRFLGDPYVLGRRRECWGWRKQLRDMKKEQKALSESTVGDDLNGPNAVAATSEYLKTVQETKDALNDMDIEGIDVDEAIVSALSEESRKQSERLSVISSEIVELKQKLDGLFSDIENTRKFRLAAVFVHRGAAGHGHYWIYIKDFADDMWRMYNDEKVEEFKKLEDIFEAKTWQQGTPTYAVYVQDDLKNDIQPVCRDPEKLPEQPAPASDPWNTTTDVQMGEASAESQQPRCIDPKLISEGGQSDWDPHRQVADATW